MCVEPDVTFIDPSNLRMVLKKNHPFFNPSRGMYYLLAFVTVQPQKLSDEVFLL